MYATHHNFSIDSLTVPKNTCRTSNCILWSLHVYKLHVTNTISTTMLVTKNMHIRIHVSVAYDHGIHCIHVHVPSGSRVISSKLLPLSCATCLRLWHAVF